MIFLTTANTSCPGLRRWSIDDILSHAVTSFETFHASCHSNPFILVLFDATFELRGHSWTFWMNTVILGSSLQICSYKRWVTKQGTDSAINEHSLKRRTYSMQILIQLLNWVSFLTSPTHSLVLHPYSEQMRRYWKIWILIGKPWDIIRFFKLRSCESLSSLKLCCWQWRLWLLFESHRNNKKLSLQKYRSTILALPTLLDNRFLTTSLAGIKSRV